MIEDELFARVEQLAEHLSRVQPMVDAFCAKHGFERVNPRALGRYPRIRIEKMGADGVHRWLDLWMELTKEGTRYTEFFETIPYELGAGAFVTFPDETVHGHRYQKGYVCFSNVPFNEVPGILPEEMEKNLPILESWTIEYLKVEGMRVRLGGSG